MPERLSATDLGNRLNQLTNWQRDEETIFRRWEFPDFGHALQFVNAVAELAEEANHHPDIDIRWNKVLLRLSTHSAGGLTDKDFGLAKKIDALSQAT